MAICASLVPWYEWLCCVDIIKGGRTEKCTDLKHFGTLVAPSFPSNIQASPVDTLVNLLVTILMKEPLLGNLKRIQQLDQLGVEAVYYLYSKLHALQGIKDISLMMLLDTQTLVDACFRELDNLSEEEMKSHIDNFLVAATAKDCSIMVTFIPVEK